MYPAQQLGVVYKQYWTWMEDMEEEGLDKRHSPKQGNVCYVDLYKVSMRETSYP